jgi:hypothetical protein
VLSVVVQPRAPDMGKKRKSEVDLDAERTLYSSFSAAANSISQLYTQAVHQQRKATSVAAKQAIVSHCCSCTRLRGLHADSL